PALCLSQGRCRVSDMHACPTYKLSSSPAVAPVTITTLPVRSGMSSTPHVGLGGKASVIDCQAPGILCYRGGWKRGEQCRAEVRHAMLCVYIGFTTAVTNSIPDTTGRSK